MRIRWALAVIGLLMLASSPIRAADSAPGFGFSSQPAQNNSSPRRVVIPTHAGLRLVLRAACANVQVFTDASDSVTYALLTDPKSPGADPAFLRSFSFNVRNTPQGVVLVSPTRAESDCTVSVTYEIHVPRRYDLDVAVRAGNIVAQDVEGAIALSTGGGEIRTGAIGAADSANKDSASRAFVAHLQTAGGDICVGNVRGGLHAATRSGQIFAGDVHGPAVLRTGGGDVYVGHVSGEAHFTSGGGDIVVRKVDGGLWADTAGGRVEIGNRSRNASQRSAVQPQFPARFLDAFAWPEIRPGSERSSEDPVVPAVNDMAEIAQFDRLFDLLFWGGIRVDPVAQQSRLIHSIAPEYPDVARLAGIEGKVVLRIFVGRDGSIRDIRPISGPPVLARAAMRAVEQWRYAPALVNGRSVDVITSVALAFRLHP